SASAAAYICSRPLGRSIPALIQIRLSGARFSVQTESIGRSHGRRTGATGIAAGAWNLGSYVTTGRYWDERWGACTQPPVLKPVALVPRAAKQLPYRREG